VNPEKVSSLSFCGLTVESREGANRLKSWIPAFAGMVPNIKHQGKTVSYRAFSGLIGN
jgi:hypothetical protein